MNNKPRSDDDAMIRRSTKREHAFLRNKIAQQQWDDEDIDGDDLFADGFETDDTLEQLSDAEDFNQNDPRTRRHQRFDGPR